MPLFRLLYCSRASVPPDYTALTAILTTAEERNRQDGLTGLLCYGRGTFVQCLEGHPAVVSRTTARILRDPRHRDVVLLDARVVTGRLFPDWGMKLVRWDDLPPDDLQTALAGPDVGLIDRDRLIAFLVRAAAAPPRG